MTVEELIARLEKMPRCMDIEIEIDVAPWNRIGVPGTEYYTPDVVYDAECKKCVIYCCSFVRSTH